jgi:hypothetical protein
MIAALAVPVQGFPVPRAQLSLSASANVEALILPAWTEEGLIAASVDPSTGPAIVLFPDPGEAGRLSQAGGVPREDLRLTLCSFPDNLDRETASGILQDLADRYGPLVGNVGGVGRMTSTDAQTLTVALASVVGLDLLRSDLIRELDVINADYSTQYGFVPHITVATGDTELPELTGESISFSAITFLKGGERHDFPFAGEVVNPEEESELPVLEEERSRDYIRRREALSAAVLTTRRRKDLPRSAFVFPGERRYPIHDLAHARNALARSSGKPEEKKVRAAVCRRYPDLCKDDA